MRSPIIGLRPVHLLLWSAWIAVLTPACEERRVLTVHLLEERAAEDRDAAVPSGFGCRCERGPGRRASTRLPVAVLCSEEAGERCAEEVTFCFDFVAWDGDDVPGCRTSELSEFCLRRRCRVDLAWRKCASVSLAELLEEGTTLADHGGLTLMWRAIERAFQGRVVDVPERPGLLRLVGTRQHLEEAARGFEPESVFGCAYGCPADFASTTEQVVLALDTFGPCDAWDVGICALLVDERGEPPDEVPPAGSCSPPVPETLSSHQPAGDE